MPNAGSGNLRAVQRLLGHTKMDSTVRYLGVELADGRAISEVVELDPVGPSVTGGSGLALGLASTAVPQPI